MNPVALEKAPVGKKKDPESHQNPPPPFARIEVHADPAWVERLDRAAKAIGVSRSALIRMLCNQYMNANPPPADTSED